MYKENITDAQRAMWDGIIQLWQRKSVYQIGIKELCQASNVARSTFYVYYANIDELVSEMEAFHMEQIIQLNAVVATVQQSSENSPFLQDMLEYLNGNKKLFYAWLVAFPNQRFIGRWKQGIKQHLLKRLTPGKTIPNQDMVLEMIAAEVVAGYTYWIQNPYDVNLEKMNEIIESTLKFIQ